MNTTCNENNDATLGPTSSENNFVENAYFSATLGLPTNVILPGTYFSGTETDDDYEASLWFGKNNQIWSITANDVYSPLYNAVIFVFGNLALSGNLTNICHSGGCEGLTNSIWRASFVSVGNITVHGTPRYAPFRSFDVLPDNQYLLVSGRDILLAGNSGGGDICPLTCTDPPANLAGYAGIILAHEQLCSTGNVTINGILKSEDAAHCADLCTGQGMEISGSVEVYYDCQHPPDNSGQTVVLQSWEENQ
jgi:hypothetical protein